MEGIIVAIKYGIYTVEVDGTFYQTSPRGIFRKDKIKPVVGDKVLLEEEHFLITDVLTRKSYLKRPCIANIDQMLLVFSLNEPAFSFFLACKYLTFANYSGVKAKIILTKSDIGDKKDEQNIINTFAKIGIETYVVSNKTLEGIETIRDILKGKISCFVGQSGVGKSSLLNSIDENFTRDIGEYSTALGRGKHQTKEVILFPYESGYIADTPGFSSLELDIKPEDLAKFFPGFDKYAYNCYFSNCMHISESKCEVKKAVENNEIPTIIYETYLKLLEEIKNG